MSSFGGFYPTTTFSFADARRKLMLLEGGEAVNYFLDADERNMESWDCVTAKIQWQSSQQPE